MRVLAQQLVLLHALGDLHQLLARQHLPLEGRVPGVVAELDTENRIDIETLIVVLVTVMDACSGYMVLALLTTIDEEEGAGISV